ncbi:hypothetical protein BCT10_19325 [Vibrio splendidus]|nr:hypothetical protein BCT10_19325 [Vibrio splendidus]
MSASHYTVFKGFKAVVFGYRVKIGSSWVKITLNARLSMVLCRQVVSDKQNYNSPFINDVLSNRRK